MIETPAACASAGPLELHRLALDEHLAAVGVVHAAEDLHQRRLARAVLAEQRVGLAGESVIEASPRAMTAPKLFVALSRTRRGVELDDVLLVGWRSREMKPFISVLER